MIIQLNAHRYSTWASLARDYLAIMGSSVSSERAFSAAGITISKWRNRLKGDIVEALECLKCLLHHDLLFRQVTFTAEIEKELDEIEDRLEGDKTYFEVVDDAEAFSWDQLVEDADDDDSPIDLVTKLD